MSNITCYASDGSVLEFLNQWSTNQKLMIRGADVSVAPVFYFSNAVIQNSIMVESEIDNSNIIVSIPDIVLQYDVPIIVDADYAFSHAADFSIRIPVMPKAKPGDYSFSDEWVPGGSQSPTIQIVDNLITDSSVAALSAAQGVVLKEMIDGIGDNIDVTDQINKALTDAKNSGEFDGRGIVSIIRTSGTGEAGTVDTYTITYTDSTTSQFSIYNGSNGVGDGATGDTGENGATFTPHLDTNGNLSWSNDKGLANPQTVNIKGKDGYTPQKNIDYFDGTDGVNGFSPIINVEEVGNGHNVIITDIDGDETFHVENGFSPKINVTDLDHGHEISIVDASGTQIIEIADGVDGIGVQSVEQTVVSSDDGGVNTITMTLTNDSVSTFNIKNGNKGSDGISVVDVQQTAISTQDDGENVITITLSNDQTFTFSVKNGSRGSSGNNALINGVNTITLKAGIGTIIEQSGSAMTVSANYEYGQTDLEPGVSNLETGKLYFVYG